MNKKLTARKCLKHLSVINRYSREVPLILLNKTTLPEKSLKLSAIMRLIALLFRLHRRAAQGYYEAWGTMAGGFKWEGKQLAIRQPGGITSARDPDELQREMLAIRTALMLTFCNKK